MAFKKLNQEQIVKRAVNLINTFEIGHGWMHMGFDAEQLNIRLDMERKSTVSAFTISQIDLQKKMQRCIELNAKSIEKWLSGLGNDKQAFRLKCKQPIGLLMSKQLWCNRKTGETCSQLVVVLKRYFDNEIGGYNFIIKTEYVEFTKEEELKIKERG